MSATEHTRRGRSGKQSPAEPRSWEEVNQRLAYLGEMERQIRALRDQFEQKVAVLKQQWIEASQPVESERERMQDQIERFYWAHRDEVLAAGRKSVELPFGRLGTRRSRSLLVEDSATVQRWLAANGLDRYLRTRTEIDREALRSALLAEDASANGEAV
ncbi:MAG: host-nuclease inhibitor Gam family protein [Acidobacteria bacterium]|nr:host-nuclease inhibitor Gam family protein [Acidobacteriota bacterium]